MKTNKQMKLNKQPKQEQKKEKIHDALKEGSISKQRNNIWIIIKQILSC